MDSPCIFDGFPTGFETLPNRFPKGIPLDLYLIRDVCLCSWLVLSSIVLLAPTSRVLGFLLFYIVLANFSYVLHCFVYDLGSVSIVVPTAVACARCLSFFVVSAVV